MKKILRNVETILSAGWGAYPDQLTVQKIKNDICFIMAAVQLPFLLS
jgi:hypothetical protein